MSQVTPPHSVRVAASPASTQLLRLWRLWRFTLHRARAVAVAVGFGVVRVRAARLRRGLRRGLEELRSPGMRVDLRNIVLGV